MGLIMIKQIKIKTSDSYTITAIVILTLLYILYILTLVNTHHSHCYSQTTGSSYRKRSVFEQEINIKIKLKSLPYIVSLITGKRL